MTLTQTLDRKSIRTKKFRVKSTSGIELIPLSFESIEIVALLARDELKIVDVLKVVLPQTFSLLHHRLPGVARVGYSTADVHLLIY